MNSTKQRLLWGWFYGFLSGATVAGVVIHFLYGSNTLLVVTLMIWMVIAILGSNATHQSEKSSRRQHTQPPKPAEYPGADEAYRFRRMQEEMNVEHWNTNDHTQSPATGGKQDG